MAYKRTSGCTWWELRWNETAAQDVHSPCTREQQQQHSVRGSITNLERLLVQLNRNRAKSRARNANETDQTAQMLLLSHLGSISNGAA